MFIRVCFVFNDTATTEIYTYCHTLSLHDALPIFGQIYRLFDNKDDVITALVEENTKARIAEMHGIFGAVEQGKQSVFDAIKAIASIDRKSTRLNSSH